MQRQEPTEDEIFRIAHAIPATDARMAYLKQACRNDVEVERIVELLKEGSADASFLEKGPLNLETKLTELAPMKIPASASRRFELPRCQPFAGFGRCLLAMTVLTATMMGVPAALEC